MLNEEFQPRKECFRLIAVTKRPVISCLLKSPQQAKTPLAYPLTQAHSAIYNVQEVSIRVGRRLLGWTLTDLVLRL